MKIYLDLKSVKKEEEDLESGITSKDLGFATSISKPLTDKWAKVKGQARKIWIIISRHTNTGSKSSESISRGGRTSSFSLPVSLKNLVDDASPIFLLHNVPQILNDLEHHQVKWQLLIG